MSVDVFLTQNEDTMAENAAYYQDNKDNEEDWEPAPAPVQRSEQRRLKTMVSVRFSPEEADRLRVEADAAGLSLSAFIRAAALCSYQPIQPRTTLATTYGSSGPTGYVSSFGTAVFTTKTPSGTTKTTNQVAA